MNYLLKVVASIAGQDCIGSGTLRVDWFLAGHLAGFDGIGTYGARSTGEAIALNFDANGPLFALIKAPSGMRAFNAWQVADTLGSYIPRRDQTEDAIKRGLLFRDCEQVLRREVSLLREYWPTFARFRDLSDPKSIELVDSGSFEKIYGPNSSIHDVTLQKSDHPVTHGINRYLPWLETQKGAFSHESGPANKVSFAARVTPLNFKLESYPT